MTSKIKYFFLSDENETVQTIKEKPRNLVAYWLLGLNIYKYQALGLWNFLLFFINSHFVGLCNNYAYIIMLSAAQ